jgi:hypothetical protein
MFANIPAVFNIPSKTFDRTSKNIGIRSDPLTKQSSTALMRIHGFFLFGYAVHAYQIP